jgi:cobalt-zinc-cadmium resistance protein CzcA
MHNQESNPGPVTGVSEVNTWGGETKQFQIKVDPERLQQYGLTLHDVATRIRSSEENCRS